MATKNDPAPHGRNYYEELGPDDEYFLLTERDRVGWMFVQWWAQFRLMMINIGIYPDSDRAAFTEAMQCATRMKRRHEERQRHKAVADAKLDANGYPTAGEHARKATSSTSGAND